MTSLLNSRTTRIVARVAVAAAFAAPTAALAQTDLSKFPLTRAIPADAFIAMAAKANPEQKFLREYWSEVSQAFHDSGVLIDCWDMFADNVPDEDLDKFEELGEQFLGLVSKVDWGDLFGKEMIYTGRFNLEMMGRGSPYEGIVIGRLDKKKAAANYAALKAILDQVAKVIEMEAGEPKVAVTETKIAGATVTSFGPSKKPMSIVSVGVKDDLIFISLFGDTLIGDCLNLLDGKGDAKRLVDSPRFKSALSQLPAAEDALVFFDVSKMLTSIGGMIEVAVAASGEQDSETQPILALVRTILKDISIVDYSVEVQWTEGYRVFGDSVAVLLPDAKKSPLYKVITSKQSLGKFDKFIPKEAESFSCSAGLDWSAAYKYLLNIVKNNIPDGQDHLEEWAAIQEEWGVDLDEDVFSLLEGSMASFSMGDQWVVLLGVTNEKKADAQVKRLFDAINDLLGEQGGLMMSQVEVAGQKNFRQVSHPMLMMMGGFSPPVIGCAEGNLIIGSSARAVSLCLKTARGDHKSIAKNKRFKAEGLTPKSGKADAVSYTDETKTAENLEAGVSALTMGLGMAGMFATGAPPELQSFLTSLPPILGKLVPVVSKLNFFQSSASCSSFDGKRWITHSVQNYKSPKQRGGGASDEAGDDDEATD